jgi:hypothetical protein
VSNGKVEEIPANMADLTEEGINNAIDAYVTNEGRAKNLADQLERNPRVVVKRVLRMNSAQRSGLSEYSDDELRDLTNPVVQALRGPNAMNFTVRYTERFETQSPLRCRTEIELQYP